MNKHFITKPYIRNKITKINNNKVFISKFIRILCFGSIRDNKGGYRSPKNFFLDTPLCSC